MKLTALVASLAVLVMLAGPSSSHEFTSTDPESPGNHKCSGTTDWVDRPGVTAIDLTVLDQAAVVYVHPPPHGDPASQDPALLPGILWIESNGLDGLQKNDFVCVSKDTQGDREPSPHSDLVVL